MSSSALRTLFLLWDGSPCRASERSTSAEGGTWPRPCISQSSGPSFPVGLACLAPLLPEAARQAVRLCPLHLFLVGQMDGPCMDKVGVSAGPSVDRPVLSLLLGAGWDERLPLRI